LAGNPAYDEGMSQIPARPRSTVRDFFRGVGILGSGLRMWITDPKVMFFGAIPALIVAAVYAVGVSVLFANFDPLVKWAASFAEDSGETLYLLAQLAVGLAFVGLTVLIVVYTFVALTLTVGDPFYERIWRRVESKLGDVPAGPETGFWRSVGDGLRMLLATIAVSLLLLLLGFIPVVGQTLVPVVGALVGGWFLALELATRPFESRALRAKDRRRILRANRATTVGFGVAVWLLFLIPFGAVIVMPAAVAGATILARNALGIPGRQSSLSPEPNLAVTPGE